MWMWWSVVVVVVVGGGGGTYVSNKMVVAVHVARTLH